MDAGGGGWYAGEGKSAARGPSSSECATGAGGQSWGERKSGPTPPSSARSQSSRRCSSCCCSCSAAPGDGEPPNRRRLVPSDASSWRCPAVGGAAGDGAASAGRLRSDCTGRAGWAGRAGCAGGPSCPAPAARDDSNCTTCCGSFERSSTCCGGCCCRSCSATSGDAVAPCRRGLASPGPGSWCCPAGRVPAGCTG